MGPIKLLCSNQPFVDRQALVAERVVEKEMKQTGGKFFTKSLRRGDR